MCIIDCNVWIGPCTLGRMWTALDRAKFVHCLPLVVDTVGTTPAEETGDAGLAHGSGNGLIRTTSASSPSRTTSAPRPGWWEVGGGRLEELFLSTAHAKFYTAINTVALAPCIVGKSSMFRLADLDALTDGAGIDCFSENICEDHLIGDLLWRKRVPEEELRGKDLRKHALCFGDLAIQPMSHMSVEEYWRRRVRWLRVRKFTVTLATLVEPGTESFLCSVYGAFACTTLPFFRDIFGIPGSWTAFIAFWLTSVSIWSGIDWTLYTKLHSGASIHLEENTPSFARPPKSGRRRPFLEWLLAWLGREALALPIWLWAFWGGTKVEWRGKMFWVGMDMKVQEIVGHESDVHANGHVSESRGKRRVD